MKTVFRTLGGATLAALAAMVGTSVVGGTIYAVFSGVAMLLLIASWVCAVFRWSRLKDPGPLHIVALVLLVPLGYFWGWAYLLAAAGDRRKAQASPN